MKLSKGKILFFSFLFLSSSVHAQLGWYRVNSGTANDLKCIKSISGVFYCCGSNGTILRSTSMGDNWVSVPSGVNTNLNGISLINNLRAFICGDGGLILMTTNQGSSWFQLNSNTASNLKSISYSYLGGAAIAVGESGTIILSTDFGDTWMTLNSGISDDLNSVFMFTSQTGWAVGKSGRIIKTTDMGTSWINQAPSAIVDLNSVFFANALTGLVCGDGGTIIMTTNGGERWFVQNGVNNLNSCILYEYIGIKGFCVGDAGTILITTNGGATWLPQLAGVNIKLNSVYADFISNTGLVAGNEGTIIKSAGRLYFFGDGKKIFANSISTWFQNIGSFNRNPVNGNSGFEWPKGSNKHARFAAGVSLGAIVNHDTLVVVNLYNSEYYPGYTNNGVPSGLYDPAYRIYRITSNEIDPERLSWPNRLMGNSDQGAPVCYDVNSRSWKPLDFGTQTMFYSYTDSYPESHGSYNGETAPLKADIKQVNYSFSDSLLNDVIYSQFTIINRHNLPWSNAYFTLYADDDVGDATDDIFACDTNLKMAYTYNGDNFDIYYGYSPPAVSFILIKGPEILTRNVNDTVFVCSGRTKVPRVGYKQLNLSSVLPCDEPFFYPRIYFETYRIMNGLKIDGSNIINPVNGLPTKFVYSGDPVTNQGWVNIYPDDQNFVMSTGPFNLNPGDTQVIVIAQVIKRGASNLNSITVLKEQASLVRKIYEDCFSDFPDFSDCSSTLSYQYRLDQNYPNPFNSFTNIRFSLSYRSAARLAVYDILGREVVKLADTDLDAGVHTFGWNAQNYASGVYFYVLTAKDLLTGDVFEQARKMVLVK